MTRNWGWAARLPLAAAILAGCTTQQMPSQPTTAPQYSRSLSRGETRSWMRPEAKHDDLLYISDGDNGTVTVYTYRKRQLVGTLTGFGVPWGLCSDENHIFVADYQNEDIVEYRHGESQPIKTLSTANYFPVDCSVNPLTGDLAVASISSQGSLGYPPGAISIYKKAKAPPKVYNTSQNLNFIACAYDNMGNLFADGSGYSGPAFQLVELPSRHKKLIKIRIKPPLSNSLYPGGLQWDGKYVALGIANSTIYQYAVTKEVAKEAGVTELSGKGVAIGLFWLGKFGKGTNPLATQLVALTNYNNPNEAQYYDYPSGGTPTEVITAALDGPLGATVSFSRRSQ